MSEREISPFNPEKHQNAIKTLQDSSFCGVRGVKELQVPGKTAGPSDPVLYLGMFTHGDESASACVLPLLLNEEIELQRGRVILSINNILAQSQRKRLLSDDPHGNMNRLPVSDLTNPVHASNPSAVIQRMRQLSQVMGGVTHGLDLHTVPDDPYAAMKLNIKGDTYIADSVAIPEYIVDITKFQYSMDDPTQKTAAFGNHIGGFENEIPVLELEAGGPETISNFPFLYASIVKGTLSVLAQLGIIELEQYNLRMHQMEQKLYRIYKWIYGLEGQHQIAREFAPFESVKQGEPIFVDANGEPFFTADRDGHVIMPPSRTGILDRSEDCWLSEPVEISTENVL